MTNTMPDQPPVSLDDAAAGLAELARLIAVQIGAWQEFGYENPPVPHCNPIPPLGERSADAIMAGREAVREIDVMTRQLHQLRAQLIGELRQDQDKRAARVDAMLAERRDGAR